jgi:hypothetical protein
MDAYKFSTSAREKKPENTITALIEKAMDFQPLSRQEKDKIADICYGVFGSQFAGYKFLGWRWDLKDCLKRFVVHFKSGDLAFYYAPDKTSLRKVISNIREIIAA